MFPAQQKYPKKSHRRIINIPSDGERLAEFLGIEMGDGGINNNWQVIISLNSILDQEYSDHIINLGFNLFNLKPALRKRSDRNVLVVVYSSTNLVEFLIKKGAVRGNKILQKINIPEWISQKPEYERSFVRGLVDTDGCLYIHKHFIKNVCYKNIGFCFTSFSRELIKSIANILNKNAIKPHITDQERRIYLYSSKSVVKYLEVFGSSNPRITNKFKQWRDV